MERLSLLVLFGGASSEHEVSCASAASVIDHLNKDQYNLYTVGITKEGNWFLTDSPVLAISEGKWKRGKHVAVTPDTGAGGLTVFEEDGTYSRLHIDVIFPVLHGKNGEDGTIQGLLDLAQIPYVGPGTTASAICMDKAITKAMVYGTEVKQADTYLTDRYVFADNPQQVLEEVEGHFKGNYPLFVKPANAGSSVGISKAKNTKELFDAIRIAAEEDHKILVEETIIGREIEVAVLGNRHPRASMIGEIIAANEFYDYEAKYQSNQSKTGIVTDLPAEKEQEIRDAACIVYRAMGCRGLSRVDFFLKEDGQVIFNEINTMPGFTSISMYPKLWEASGITYSDLLDTLIQLATGEIE